MVMKALFMKMMTSDLPPMTMQYKSVIKIFTSAAYDFRFFMKPIMDIG